MKEPKKYPCKQCGNEVRIRSKGLCPLCRSLELKTPIMSDISRKKAHNGGNKSKAGCLDIFFQHHTTEISKFPYCKESGDFIHPIKLHVAHLFPKRNHKSVACNLDNAIYLSWQKHFDFDKHLDKHEFEKLEEWKIWNEVVEKFKKLLPHVTEVTSFSLALEDYLFNR